MGRTRNEFCQRIVTLNSGLKSFILSRHIRCIIVWLASHCLLYTSVTTLEITPLLYVSTFQFLRTSLINIIKRQLVICNALFLFSSTTDSIVICFPILTGFINSTLVLVFSRICQSVILATVLYNDTKIFFTISHLCFVTLVR